MAVKRGFFNAVYGRRVQAVDVDTQAIRMRSRHIKWLYPAVPAKCVLRYTRIERVRRQFILTRDQAEIAVRHEQMQETAHVTDAAIAPRRLNIPRRIDFKSHAAAVATTLVSRHLPFFLQTARWLLAGIA